MFSFFGDRYSTKQIKVTGSRNILIYDDLNNLVCFIKQKDKRDRKEIVIYEDETESSVVLHLSSKKIRDTQPVVSVLDARQINKIGSLRQDGYQWFILDNDDNEIARLKRRTALEIIKDVESGFFSKKVIIEMKNQKKVVAEINKKFPSVLNRHYIDFSKDGEQLLDRRLGLSACVMHILDKNEGKSLK
ncbi:MAG: hypothetical protein JXJ04_09720 [Spirochaetales bacterium]|nr:hypothetical protein [Spirochaetales bacterium]